MSLVSLITSKATINSDTNEKRFVQKYVKDFGKVLEKIFQNFSNQFFLTLTNMKKEYKCIKN